MSFLINFLEPYGSLPQREGFEHWVLSETVVLPSCMPVAALPAMVPQLALLHPHRHAGRDTTTKVIFPLCAASKRLEMRAAKENLTASQGQESTPVPGLAAAGQKQRHLFLLVFGFYILPY